MGIPLSARMQFRPPSGSPVCRSGPGRALLGAPLRVCCPPVVSSPGLGTARLHFFVNFTRCSQESFQPRYFTLAALLLFVGNQP